MKDKGYFGIGCLNMKIYILLKDTVKSKKGELIKSWRDRTHTSYVGYISKSQELFMASEVENNTEWFSRCCG